MQGQAKAERKVEKAIDALVELQSSSEILERAGIQGDAQHILDELNHLLVCIEAID